MVLTDTSKVAEFPKYVRKRTHEVIAHEKLFKDKVICLMQLLFLFFSRHCRTLQASQEPGCGTSSHQLCRNLQNVSLPREAV